jgi:plastocyanin
MIPKSGSRFSEKIMLKQEGRAGRRFEEKSSCSGVAAVVRSKSAALAFGALGLVLAATTARAEVIQIKMEKLGFIPAQVTAHVGDTIEWVNADFVAHTATARDGAWDVLIPVNATRSVVLKAAGQVDYYCKFHPNMTGQISVSK